jgi:hypothetical protein
LGPLEGAGGGVGEGAGSVVADPRRPRTAIDFAVLVNELGEDEPPRSSAGTAAFFTRLLRDCLSRLSWAVSPSPPSVEVDGEGGKKRFCLQKTDVSRDLLSDNQRVDTSKNLILLN